MVRAGRARHSKRPGEFEIIARYFAPLAAKTKGALGLKDDAAIFAPPDGCDLVVTIDALVAGVHFRETDAPADLAFKALAVNVSDLTAKGADPAVFLLSLSLCPEADGAWIKAFAKGLGQAQTAFACKLAGGDTTATRGPTSVAITALGTVPAGRMVMRSGAKPGDRLFVTGTIGDGALGLDVLQTPKTFAKAKLGRRDKSQLRMAYLRPRPPVAIAAILRAHANASLDISDGLLGDLRKLCAASTVGAEIHAEKVPLSKAARKAVASNPKIRERILTGGDDYQVLTAVPDAKAGVFVVAAKAAGVPVTEIGRMLPASAGVKTLDADGKPVTFKRDSYEHS